MATKKKLAPVITPNAHIRLVSHTARMLAVLERDKKHPRKPEYEKTIADYSAKWAALSPEQRKAARASAQFPDIDAKTLKDAVAALEGK